MLGLKQLIPSSTCLHCQICCRFPEKNTVWQPRLSRIETVAFKNEAPRAKARGFLERNTERPRLQGAVLWPRMYKRWLAARIKKGAIELKRIGGLFCCSFFNAKGNSCQIYKIRPFDCRLYPFVLIDLQDKIILAAHQLCPFVAQSIQTKKFQSHASYLKKFFAKKGIQDFLKANPSLIQDYQGYSKELIPLFPLTR
ncbi:MAG: YkgJ family cysteine cluster protein [Candidatus Omnitrophota bacterium]|nr:YkgJ family cysteine cluster protein [Candidatus Omnitrophota bacterium]